MASESEIPTAPHEAPRLFALRLALFYATVFGLVGTHLPFFPVWLKAIGIDAFWIGIITAVPSLTRFTVLPLITSLTERRRMLRGAMMLSAFATAIGFAVIGTQRGPIAVLIAYVLTACLWTPVVPLTDGYALKAVKLYRLNYGPLRLWGSAAFVVGALACGVLIQTIEAQHVIWVIAAIAALGALTSLGLRPLDTPSPAQASSVRARSLLRDPGFLTIIIASALIQGSHAAYYTFASIDWQSAGYDGLTIAGLWVLGVLAEIVVFALSPRLTMRPTRLVMIAAGVAILRWLVTAQSPPLAVLALVQLMHGLTFGLTMISTMNLMARHVPGHIMASAQGYLVACTGIVMAATSIASGPIYQQIGQGVYDVMAVMALIGGGVMWAGQRRAGVAISI